MRLLTDLELKCAVYNASSEYYLAAGDPNSSNPYPYVAKNPFSLPQVLSKRGFWRSSEEIINDVLGPAATQRTAVSLAPTRRSPYLGLRNLGASCYMNAYIQCLFLNYDFRNKLYAAWEALDNQYQDASWPPHTPTLYELARLFATLQHGAVAVGDPAGMARALCVSGRTQEDATELASLLLNALETELTLNGLSTDLVDLFKGTMQHSVTCNECHNVSTRTETFQELRVQAPRSAASRAHTCAVSESEVASDETDASVVVEVHATAQSEICQRAKRRQQQSKSRSNVAGRHQVLSLERMLQQVFRKEALRKQNQYECTKCERKVDASKEIKLEAYPQYLQVCFERYKFNPYSGERTKLLNTIRFPLQLDISTYLAGGRPKKSVEYSLMAVLEHIGHSAVSGHYRAKVRDCAYRKKGAENVTDLSSPDQSAAAEPKVKKEQKVKAEEGIENGGDVEDDKLTRAATQSEQLGSARITPRRRVSATPPPSFRFSERNAAWTPEESGLMTCPTKRAASTMRSSHAVAATSPTSRKVPRTPRSRTRGKRKCLSSADAVDECHPANQSISLSELFTAHSADTSEQKSSQLHKGGLLGGEKRETEVKAEPGLPLIKRRRVNDNGEQNLDSLQLFHRRWKEDNVNCISLEDPERHEWIEFDDQSVRVWRPDNVEAESPYLTSESAYLFVYRKVPTKLVDIDYTPSRLQRSVTSVIDETAQSIEHDERCRRELHSLCDQVRSGLLHITSTLKRCQREVWEVHRHDKMRLLNEHCFISRYALQGLLNGEDYDLLRSVFGESRHVTVMKSFESPHLGVVVSARVAEAQKGDCSNCSTPANERRCSHGKVDPLLVVEGHYKLVPKLFLESLNYSSNLIASDYMCHSCCDLIYACALTTMEIHNVFQKVWASAHAYEQRDDSADLSSSISASQKSEMRDEVTPSSLRLLLRVRTLMKLEAALLIVKPDRKKRLAPRLGSTQPSLSMTKETVLVAVVSVRKSLIHLRKRCLQSLVQEEGGYTMGTIDLDQHLLCLHGSLLVAKKMRTAVVSASLMQKLSELEEMRSELMMKFLDIEGGLGEEASIRRFSKPNQRCIIADDTTPHWCDTCTDESRSRHNLKMYKKMPEHRKQLPQGHYDMLFNPRFFMLAELDQRGRRYFQSFPATGIHYVVNAQWLSQLVLQSSFEESHDASATALLVPENEADIYPGPQEHVLKEITQYFSEAQRNAGHKFWWQPIFHHFSADLPVGSTDAVFGGYFVYNTSIHGVSPLTEEVVRSVVLVPESTLSAIFDILAVSHRPCRATQVRVCRYPLTYKQVLDCSQLPEGEELVDDVYYQPLRVLNLDAAAPDSPQPHLNILVQTQLSESRALEGGLIAAVDTTRIVPVTLPYDGLVEFSLITFTILQEDC